MAETEKAAAWLKNEQLLSWRHLQKPALSWEKARQAVSRRQFQRLNDGLYRQKLCFAENNFSYFLSSSNIICIFLYTRIKFKRIM